MYLMAGLLEKYWCPAATWQISGSTEMPRPALFGVALIRHQDGYPARWLADEAPQMTSGLVGKHGLIPADQHPRPSVGGPANRTVVRQVDAAGQLLPVMLSHQPVDRVPRHAGSHSVDSAQHAGLARS